jgi:hypothetical protein
MRAESPVSLMEKGQVLKAAIGARASGDLFLQPALQKFLHFAA